MTSEMTATMTATRSVILLSLSLFYSDASNESNKKQKGVGEENESKYIVRMYVCIYIYIWFVCTVAVAAMIYFPVKRRIFVFPAVEMNVGQKWPRNKRPALNTHAYFIRMNYCGRLCLPFLPSLVTSTTNGYTYRALPSRRVR